MDNPFPGYGLGLRAPHYDVFLKERPASVGWLEIISENYITAHSGYRRMLADLRHDYPFVMHGVSLSIGSTDRLDEDYLAKIKHLADFLEVSRVSDHLCFTGINGENSHDLLPVPYTEEALAHIVPRIHKAQEAIGRRYVFENASSYAEFAGSTMNEAEFLAELHARTGCAILLDVNNVYVSAFNHGFDAKTYIDALPAEAIEQYHLAGYTHKKTHIIDTHDAPVSDPVYDLFAYTVNTKGERDTMIERDGKIPPFAELEAELSRVKTLAKKTLAQQGKAA